MNETGNPYGRPDEIPGAAAGANGWPQQGPGQSYPGQGPQPGPNGWQQPAQAQAPGSSGGWGQQQGQAPGQSSQGQGQAPGSSGAWGQQPQQQAPNPWGQQGQQPPNPWGQQQPAPQRLGQAPQGYAQPQAPQYQGQQYQGQQYQGQQPYTPQQQYQGQQAPPQPPRDGLTANPFALPGQDAYAGYSSAPQGQPVNPYAATPLGVNADAKRDDQTWLERTGLSKGKAVWLGVLLVAAAGFFTYDKFFSTDPDKAKVGDCVHTAESAYDVKTVSCTDPSATAKVLARFDGTSDKAKCDPYIVEGGGIYRQMGKGAFTLCLGPLTPAPADSSDPTSAS